jgi:hypothetical protein
MSHREEKRSLQAHENVVLGLFGVSRLGVFLRESDLKGLNGY